MAIAKTVKSKISRVTLELSRAEALVLLHLLRRTEESPNVSYESEIVTAYSHVIEIRSVLALAFAAEFSSAEMNSTNVFGGKAMPARTHSLLHLDPSEK
jgi:hypothetical protein